MFFRAYAADRAFWDVGWRDRILISFCTQCIPVSGGTADSSRKFLLFNGCCPPRHIHVRFPHFRPDFDWNWTYSLVHVNGILSSHDIRDGGPSLLGVPLGLGLGGVLRHFNGLQERRKLAQLIFAASLRRLG